MSRTFQEAMEIAYDKGWKASYGSLGQGSKSDQVARLIKNYPCEAVAHRLLGACKMLVGRNQSKCPIYEQEWEDINNMIAKAEAKEESVSPEMDALMEIYKLGVNPISEQGCTYDVDFLCLIRDMQQVAKKAIEKSEENENA